MDHNREGVLRLDRGILKQSVSSEKLYVRDRETAVRFTQVVVNILSSNLSSSRLRRLCRMEIRKELERQHHLEPVSQSTTCAELLQRRAYVPLSVDKPHASDVVAMASAIILTAGDVPVTDAPLRPERMKADHLEMHRDCTETCYFWLLYRVALCGWDLPRRRYEHRNRPNHGPFVKYGRFSELAIEKQIRHSGAILDASVEPLGNIKLNPLLAVVRASEVMLAKLMTDVTISDEGTMAKVNAALHPREIKLRVCLDLTSSGVNSAQPSFPFSYASPDDAAALMSPGCWMAKLDLDAMFLSMPISYRSRRFFGFRVRNKVYYYRRTPFGGKLFPAVMTAFMAEVSAIAHSRGVERVVGYMDDFIVMAATAEDCQRDLDIVIDILVSHGWSIARDKVTKPSQVCEFLGIIFDSNRMALTIDASKAQVVLYKLLAVEKMVSSGVISDPQLLASVTGNLSWFSGVVTTGRLYLRAFYDLSRSSASCTDGIPSTFEPALQWWKTTLLTWSDSKMVGNNVRLLAPSSATEFIYYQGDAGDDGMGFFHRPVGAPDIHWHAAAWPGVVPFSSTEKELSTLLWALTLHGESWANRVVVGVFDSSASALGINNGTSTSPACWFLLKQIYEAADRHSINLAALWTPRESNTFADMLTHFCVASRVDCADGVCQW